MEKDAGLGKAESERTLDSAVIDEEELINRSFSVTQIISALITSKDSTMFEYTPVRATNLQEGMASSDGCRRQDC